MSSFPFSAAGFKDPYNSQSYQYRDDGEIIEIAEKVFNTLVPDLKGLGQKGNKGQKGVDGVGSKGQKGSRGPSGPTGPKGEPGFGAKGSKGNKGVAGNKGDCPKGNKGSKGEPGNVLAKGVKGQKGAAGAKGSKGSGAKGTAGAKGDKGEKGEKGATGLGAKGQKGSKGQKGAVGDKGATGLGTKGQKGSLGSTGPAGPAGPQGQKGQKGTGTKGQKGKTGAKGHKGETSDKGQKGETGAKGQKGTGTKGQKGSAGPIGLQGPKGDKGSGEKGQKGETGDKGQKGETGAKGQKGTGTKGQKGSAGPIGLQGPKGDKGSGEKGQKGETGDKGHKGETGDKGQSFTFAACAPNGSAAAPPYTFANQKGTGMFLKGADTLGMSTGGVERASISSSSLETTVVHRSTNGSQAAPTFSFTSDPNTGMYRSAADTLALATGGSSRATISNTVFETTVVNQSANGTAGAPTYSFSSDPDTGVYRSGTNTLAFATNASRRFQISADGRLWGDFNGTNLRPTYSWSDDDTTGMFYNSANTQIRFTVDGFTQLLLDSNYALFIEQVRGPVGTNVAPTYAGGVLTNYGLNVAGVLQMVVNGVVITETTATTFVPGIDIGPSLGSSSRRWDGIYAILSSGSGTNLVHASSGEVLRQSSDLRIKKNINSTPVDWYRINALRVVDFDIKTSQDLADDAEANPGDPFYQNARVSGEDCQNFGLIAQEVAPVFPNLVTGDEDNGYAVVYNQLSPLLLRHIQDMHARLKVLEQAAVDNGWAVPGPPDDSAPTMTVRTPTPGATL